MLEIVNSGDAPAHGWRVTITSPSEVAMPGRIRSKSGTQAQWAEQAGRGRAGVVRRTARNPVLVRGLFWYGVSLRR
jgi:hypothetical protein